MSISDELRPSIFCRKVEKARPMREEMDVKAVYFPPESAYSVYDVIVLDSTSPYLYLDLACRQLCFLQEKVQIGETKVQDISFLFSGEVLMIIFQYC